jgi:CRP-like cAMP-binding protein
LCSNYTMSFPLKHIFDKMNGICRMPEKFHLLLIESIVRLEVPRNHVLLKIGQVCDYYYYIEKGILSSHRLDKEKEYCAWVMFPGDIATAVDSFNNRVPSNETVRAATDCVLHLLSWKNVIDFTDKHRAFAKIRQSLTDYYHLQARDLDVQRQHPPEEFYAYLKEKHAEHFNLIPRKLLASYMGISEASLYNIIKNSKL